MIASQLLAIVASLAASASAAAIKPRARTCTLTLQFSRTQNPAVGGDNTHPCFASLDYGNGRSETLETECNKVTRDHCFASQLPYSICIHTNGKLEDGYLDYAAEHVDFHDDGCHREKWASIAGDGASQKCSFPCE